jgi:hypothetical protein
MNFKMTTFNRITYVWFLIFLIAVYEILENCFKAGSMTHTYYANIPEIRWRSQRDSVA